jgi:hypothetical protein
MKHNFFTISRNFALLSVALMLFSAVKPCIVSAQQLIVNLAPIEGISLTPDNVLSFQIQSTFPTPTKATITGDLNYKATNLNWHYSFTQVLQPGLNTITTNVQTIQWTFSSTAFRELFMDYKKLPEGTYEYCVAAMPTNLTGEPFPIAEGKECSIQLSNDLFLINLISPENDAKLYEYYPLFSWVVNYPFASLLTYKIRVAKIANGQTVENAIARNNAVYQENRLPQTFINYPISGTPLVSYQPYAWTIDAYYKDILLGGAAPWKFTIIDDSLQKTLPHESYFVDIKNENKATNYYAVGCIKLKYVLEDRLTEDVHISLFNKEGREIQFPQSVLHMKLGDNRCEIELKEKISLKHLGVYTLKVVDASGQVFQLPIQYVNPDFL